MNVLEKVSVTKTVLGIARPPQSKVILGKVKLKNAMGTDLERIFDRLFYDFDK